MQKKKKGVKTTALVIPENNGKQLSVTPTPFNSTQLLSILQRTPAQHIYKRPAKGGGTWEYVTGTYVKKVLNYVFGWCWSFEIKDKGREGDLVWVLGRLTIQDPKTGQQIVKEQFGRADIKMKKDTKVPLDYGNDLKSASTDALKKCASELGIASDIYGRNEFKDIQAVDKGFVPPAEEVQVITTDEQTTLEPKKVEELKKMLKGNTDEEKMADLLKKTGITLRTFKITEKHASVLVANLLNSQV